MFGISYIAGLSQLGLIYQSHNMYMYHKTHNILSLVVVHPKEITAKERTIQEISPKERTLKERPPKERTPNEQHYFW